MKYYTYYPGCSAKATAVGLDLSAQAIAKPLEMELIELEDWTCCGSTPYGSLDELESIIVAARNLALALKTGFDLVTPCSSCFVTLSKANLQLKEHPLLMSQANEALAIANLEYNGNVRVRHLTEVLLNDITPEVIATKVKRPLNGLKVAPYYGCQLVRPDYGFDDQKMVCRVNEALCKGCGACVGGYPSDVISLSHFTNEQIIAQMEGMLI